MRRCAAACSPAGHGLRPGRGRDYRGRFAGCHPAGPTTYRRVPVSGANRTTSAACTTRGREDRCASLSLSTRYALRCTGRRVFGGHRLARFTLRRSGGTRRLRRRGGSIMYASWTPRTPSPPLLRWPLMISALPCAPPSGPAGCSRRRKTSRPMCTSTAGCSWAPASPLPAPPRPPRCSSRRDRAQRPHGRAGPVPPPRTGPERPRR